MIMKTQLKVDDKIYVHCITKNGPKFIENTIVRKTNRRWYWEGLCGKGSIRKSDGRSRFFILYSKSVADHVNRIKKKSWTMDEKMLVQMYRDNLKNGNPKNYPKYMKSTNYGCSNYVSIIDLEITNYLKSKEPSQSFGGLIDFSKTYSNENMWFPRMKELIDSCSNT